MKHFLLSFLILIVAFSIRAQSNNNAVQNGNWSDCNTWNNPGILYNSDQDNKTLLPNIDVTQDQNQVFAKKITLSNGSKIIFPSSGAKKISFIGTGSETLCNSDPDFIDNVYIDFNETNNVKSVSGFLQGLNSAEDARNFDCTLNSSNEGSLYPIDDAVNKINPLKPKLFRQGEPSKYDNSYELAQRVHMVLADSWGRQCYSIRDFSNTSQRSCENCYDTQKGPCDYNVEQLFKSVPYPNEITKYENLLDAWFDWGQNRPGIIWECWNEPDYYVTWQSQDRETEVLSDPTNTKWKYGSYNNGTTTSTGILYWPAVKRQAFFETYRIFYSKLRSMLGNNALAAGPSLAFFDEGNMRAFFDYCLDNHLEVNVVTWHELAMTLNTEAILQLKTHVEFIRNEFMNNPKYSALKIQYIEINETVFETYKDNPAIQALYLKNLEDAIVDYACKTCWETTNDDNCTNGNSKFLKSSCTNNTLNNLFNREGHKRANWWVYKLYADGVSSRVKVYNEQIRSAVIASSNIAGTVPYKQVLFGYTEDVSLPLSGHYLFKLKHVGSGNSLIHYKIYKIPNPANETQFIPIDPITGKGYPEEYHSGFQNLVNGDLTLNLPTTLTFEKENLYQLVISSSPFTPTPF